MQTNANEKHPKTTQLKSKHRGVQKIAISLNCDSVWPRPKQGIPSAWIFRILSQYKTVVFNLFLFALSQVSQETNLEYHHWVFWRTLKAL